MAEKVPEAEPNAAIEEVLRKLRQIQKYLDTYINAALALREGRYLDAEKWLARTKSLPHKLSSELVNATQLLSEFNIEATASQLAVPARMYYRETFERALDELGLQRNGTWPSYIIADVLRVEVDLDANQVTVDGSRTDAIEPQVVAQQLRKRLSQLLEGTSPLQDFVSALRQSYQTNLMALGEAMGAYVDIREVFKKVKQAFESKGEKRYSESNFAVDLYQALKSGPRVLEDGAVMELSPAQDAAGGIYVPAVGGGNYIAALRFVRRSNAV